VQLLIADRITARVFLWQPSVDVLVLKCLLTKLLSRTTKTEKVMPEKNETKTAYFVYLLTVLL